MVRGECAHPPAPIPRHLKGLSAIQVFCLSLAESQIFLKVWIYDFHIINKAKIKCFFPQCHREQGSVFLWISGLTFLRTLWYILWALEVTAVCSHLGLFISFQLVPKFTCLLSLAFTTKTHILKYYFCQKKQNGQLSHCHNLFNSKNPWFEYKILVSKCVL